MAGQEIDLGFLGEDLVPAWQTVIDISDLEIATSWTLIGGLMVELHARRAGVFMPRPTKDVDVLVDYVAQRSSLGASQAALQSLGFQLSDSAIAGYRFEHLDGRRVDLMVADHLPSKMKPRLGRRPAFEVSGGEQAIRRRDRYRLSFGESIAITLGVPDVTGALVLKGAAWLSDNRNRERHIDDAAVLLASAGDVSQLDYGNLSKNDRRRLRAILGQLLDSSKPSWVSLRKSDAEIGFENLQLIRQRLEIEPAG